MVDGSEVDGEDFESLVDGGTATATAGTSTVARPLQQYTFVYFADSTNEYCYCLIHIDLTLGPPFQQQPPAAAALDLQEVVALNTRLIYDGWSRNSLNAALPTDLRSTVQEELTVALPSVKVWAAGADQPVADVIREKWRASEVRFW